MIDDSEETEVIGIQVVDLLIFYLLHHVAFDVAECSRASFRIVVFELIFDLLFDGLAPFSGKCPLS